MQLLPVVVCLLALAPALHGKSLSAHEQHPENSLDGATRYLRTYGYLDPVPSSGGDVIADDVFARALREFQRIAHVKESGVLDKDTLRMMATPRCGNKDLGEGSGQVEDGSGPGEEAKGPGEEESGPGEPVERVEGGTREKRYSVHPYKWRTSAGPITWSLSDNTYSLPHQEVQKTVTAAFRVWSDVADIDFRQEASGGTIDIRFAGRAHGDPYPFDGRGGVLAHASPPMYGGDAHFDEDENWTVRSRRGKNLFQIVAHEVGHSVGLLHSANRGALMAPFYRKYIPNFRLSQDDIAGIQLLYGARREDEGSLPRTAPHVPGVSGS